MLPLHIDYGQLAARREWLALIRFCKACRIARPVRVDVRGLGIIPSGLTRSSSRWRANPFFPGRNLILASIASGVGYSRGFRTIAFGFVANTLYPDSTQEFVTAASAALSEAMGARIQVTAPLLRFSKRQTAELGRAVRAPTQLTYSCQVGGAIPCARCSSCRDRTSALAENTVRSSRRRRATRTSRTRGDQ